MQVHKSYRIWMTQRSGSTLLCEGLSQTGVAGLPGEHFNLMDAKNLREKYGLETYAELKAEIHRLGTGENGIFGIKHSRHATIYDGWTDELRLLQGLDPSAGDQAVFADLFPNCQHIFLTRRNKIRQAVSWWKAIKDGVWHLKQGENQSFSEDFWEDNYVPDALTHLYKEVMLKECGIQEYFSRYDIQPLTVVYEDMLDDFPATIQRILDYLGIEETPKIVPEKLLARTANAESGKWVQRFRKDIQEGMGQKIW
ncbi:Stf0 family sulfotransferase [Neolewinella agarilytica]|uniref:Stf0 family sulfotransferase n=1 Tax=Neolewinella agarilytica TaxID=478744 RepID=UPI00235690A8|nr:Stf0 family sulfotransferase [Neolewinella agarilytica]